MKKSKKTFYKEFIVILLIVWVLLGTFLLYEHGIITGKLTYAPAQGGEVTRVDVIAKQDLWKGIYGTISTGATTDNTLTINYSNTTNEIFNHNLVFPDNCRYGRLILTTKNNFDYTGLRFASHANHDAYLGIPPYTIASANIFSQTRTYNIGIYQDLSLYTAQLNAALGYFYQSFGMYGTNDIFYILPIINNGKGFNGNDANYQFLIPKLQDTMSYYFYFDNSTCQEELNTTPPKEETIEILLSLQVPERICVNQEIELLAVDLNKRLYCVNREDSISQSQCREIPDADIEIYYEDEEDSIASLTTDENGIALFTPTKIGQYKFDISTQEYSGTKTTYVGSCENYDTIVIESSYNYTNQSTQGAYIETPTSITPSTQGPIFSQSVTAAVSLVWGILSIPLFLGLLALYYMHYKDSAKWLLKLRIYVEQAKVNAQERVKK